MIPLLLLSQNLMGHSYSFARDIIPPPGEWRDCRVFFFFFSFPFVFFLPPFPIDPQPYLIVSLFSFVLTRWRLVFPSGFLVQSSRWFSLHLLEGGTNLLSFRLFYCLYRLYGFPDLSWIFSSPRSWYCVGHLFLGRRVVAHCPPLLGMFIDMVGSPSLPGRCLGRFFRSSFG